MFELRSLVRHIWYDLCLCVIIMVKIQVDNWTRKLLWKTRRTCVFASKLSSGFLFQGLTRKSVQSTRHLSNKNTAHIVHCILWCALHNYVTTHSTSTSKCALAQCPPLYTYHLVRWKIDASNGAHPSVKLQLTDWARYDSIWNKNDKNFHF